MRLSRGCYDKYHRCPGWAGGGTKSPPKDRLDRCSKGRIRVPLTLWKWRFCRCTSCGVVVWPYITRWLDPGWWRWQVRWLIRRR